MKQTKDMTGSCETNFKLKDYFEEKMGMDICYWIFGILTLASLKRAMMLTPLMLAGLVGGMLSSRFINEKIARKIVVVMLIVSGTALIIQAVG